MAKEKEAEIIEIQQSKIIKDERQLSVRIPSDMALEFLINSKIDGFLWTIEKEEEGLTLRGKLIKGLFKNEKKD